jgi:hypothetical protein
LTSYGKVPSLIDHQGSVCGISDWNNKYATDQDLERWSREPDYGICVITRHVRAFDVDVTDPDEAKKILALLEDYFGRPLYRRVRADSPKFLVPFICAGEFAKRVMTVKGGIIEWLATGQQFLAAGTHKDGSRYEWEPSLPVAFPESTLEIMDTVWESGLASFATEPLKPRRRVRRKSAVQDTDLGTFSDPVAQFLVSQGKVLDTTKDGKFYLTCPWKDAHTSDSGMTETTYFAAGSGGYERGHFVCLHAHCAGRTDSEFLEAVGYATDGFETLAGPIVNHEGPDSHLEHEAGPPAVIDPHSPLDLPNFERNGKSFKIKATLNNALLGADSPRCVGVSVLLDLYLDEMLLERDSVRRPFMDPDYTQIRATLERGSSGFEPVSHEMIQKAVQLVARRHCVHSLQDYMESVGPWEESDEAHRDLL